MKTITTDMVPPALYFFVYLLWREEDAENPLQTHLVQGFDRASTEETRRIVQAGVKVSELLYLGPVCELIPHAHRRLDTLLFGTETIIDNEPESCPQCGSFKRAEARPVPRGDILMTCEHAWHSREEEIHHGC